MKVCHVITGSILTALAALPLAAQTPVLSSIEAPYPALRSQVKIAGGTYGPGAVPYGPVGTPLVLSGTDFGADGTVQFVPYNHGVAGTPVQATVPNWNSAVLFVVVPAGAESGLVTVTVEGKTSNGLPFIVMPGAYAGNCPVSPPSSDLQITTSGLSDGTVDQAYSATLSATGGAQSYIWSITSGSLPGGLSLNSSTGVISGTPTGAAGPIDLTVEVADSSNPQQANQAVLSLTIESQTLTPATIYTYSASFDGVGNVTVLNDSIMGSWTFQSPGYDTLNRLVNGSASSGPYSGQNACWTYDPFGNRTSEALSQTACNSNPPLMSWATYTTSNTNRMDTDSSSNLYGMNPVYDAGNLKNDGGNTYLYDAEGRICAVESTPVAGYTTMTGYLYNAEGERVAKGTITSMSCDPGTNGFQLTDSYVLGQSGEELTQLDGNNNWQRTNVYGAGKQLATYDLIPDPSGTTPNEVPSLHFQLTDPLGTRRMQTSAVGQPETDIQSLPFGDGLNSFPDQYAPATADDATPLHFTGKERDAESGNDYFGARYYGSSMGRFTSPDDGSDQNALNPASWNLYSYVQNNPLTNTDPDGQHIQICTTLNGTQHCTDMEDDQYAAAQQAKNGGGLSGPSLANLENSSSGSGNITDSSGNVVGTVQWTPDNPGIQGPGAIEAFGQIGNEGMGAVKAFMAQQALQLSLGVGGAAAEYGYGAWKAARSLNEANEGNASEIAENIVNHAYGKHVVDRGEFGNISPNEFKARIEDTILNPSDARSLSNGRTAYWSDKEQMVVIENSTAPSQSTAFRPTGGKSYFDNLR